MRSSLSAIFAFMVPVLVTAADVELFSTSMHKESAAPGVRLNYSMTFTEIERGEATSIVEIVYTPSRNPDEVDVLRGACGLMKARGEKFMLSTLRVVSREPLREEITFVKSAPEDFWKQMAAGIVSLTECEKNWLPKVPAN